ncbi:MAG: hypothetical protein EOM91_01585 [Sphingobacteriia bacterium]|nr:hypothetical protein [Sphingobacteriia bacterium]NCC39331.1 hypothetical protein [Gammaproteobacteria bacterium]
MKYYLGAVCLILGAWLVYQAIVHRRAVIDARTRAAAQQREQHIRRELEGMRLGLAPIFVIGVLVTGFVLAAIWFVVDKQGVFSILDIAGFLLVLMAYAFWMSVRIQYTPIGLESKHDAPE